MAELIKDPDLLALFHFDDNLTDATGLITMTSLQGSTAYTNGKFDKGLTMSGDGSTGWNVSNINLGTGDFTLEFWFYGTAQPTKYAKFFESSRYDTAGGIMAEVNPNTTTCYVRQCGSDYLSHQISFNYSLNVWTHLAVVRNSGTITVYENGISVGSFDASNNLTSTDIKIGASADTNNNVSAPCIIDELRISNIARWSNAFTPPNAPYSSLIEQVGFYAWDVYNLTSTASKGTINTSATSTNANTYPQDAIFGSYWYTFRGAPSNINYPSSIIFGEPITITWSEGINPIAYQIERSSDGGVTWDILANDLTVTQYTDTNTQQITTSTGALYKVCAIGDAAKSEYATGTLLYIIKSNTRIKIANTWRNAKVVYVKRNGVWESVPVDDEIVLFQTIPYINVISLLSS